MTTTTASIYRLADVHPHHVERIKSVVDAHGVGSVVTYVGRGDGSFFTGIKTGTRSIVTDVHPTGSRSIVSAARPGAALCVHRTEVATDIERLPLVDWTPDDIETARLSVESHAQSLMENARHAAEQGNDERAVEYLRESSEAKRLAFALRIWLTFTDGR
jgi:hypothetical protein